MPSTGSPQDARVAAHTGCRRMTLGGRRRVSIRLGDHSRLEGEYLQFQYIAARQQLLLLLWSGPIKSVGTGAFLACPGLNSTMSTDLIGAQVHSPPHVRPGRQQHVILHMPYVRCHITQCMHCLPYWLVRATQTAHQRSMKPNNAWHCVNK